MDTICICQWVEVYHGFGRYDVCEDCFVGFAVEGMGDEALATRRRE
jgi:hypothetical protein